MIKRNKNSYDRIILLIRDPADSILSEFNREQSGGKHTGFAKEDKFKAGNLWHQFVKRSAYKWLLIYKSWLEHMSPSDILVVFYKDLVEKTETELRRLMKFLELDFREEDMKCTLERKKGLFKRSHDKTKKDLERFDKDERELITGYYNQLLTNFTLI